MDCSAFHLKDSNRPVAFDLAEEHIEVIASRVELHYDNVSFILLVKWSRAAFLAKPLLSKVQGSDQT